MSGDTFISSINPKKIMKFYELMYYFFHVNNYIF